VVHNEDKSRTIMAGPLTQRGNPERLLTRQTRTDEVGRKFGEPAATSPSEVAPDNPRARRHVGEEVAECEPRPRAPAPYCRWKSRRRHTGLGTPPSLDRIGSQPALARRQPLPSPLLAGGQLPFLTPSWATAPTESPRVTGVAQEHGADAAGWMAPRGPLAGH
jgi:hypothetical protein